MRRNTFTKYNHNGNTPVTKRNKTLQSPAPPSKQVKVQLFNHQEAAITVPYQLYDNNQKRILQKHRGRWNPQQKAWIIPIKQLEAYYQTLKNQSQLTYNRIPKFVQQLLGQFPKQLKVKHKYQKVTQVIAQLRYPIDEVQLNVQSVPYYSKLYQYQRQGVKQGIKKHGRILIGDQMGVGKTVQGLTIANLYIYQWPLLIITPSSLKFTWKHQCLLWYEFIKQPHIQIIQKTKEQLKSYCRICIVSFDLAGKRVDQLEKFKVCIVDQCHFLKSLDTDRSNHLVPFLKKRKRVVLLSGTPALARPKQLFNIISIIRPDILNNFKDYGSRYCDPKKSRYTYGLQYLGCSNSKQLHFILKTKLMIRRLKQDVLHYLPQKQRQKVILQTNQNIVNQIKAILKSVGNKNFENMLNNLLDGNTQSKAQENQAFLKAYRLSGSAKIQSALAYLDQLLANDVKILCFAHHHQILDSVQKKFIQKKITFIRIDGGVNPQQRFKRVQKFQKGEVQVALLSIIAAGIGLTLTAASTVVFLQMTFTPAQMLQAQDRVHRIGQKNHVNCHYLIGQDTLDEVIYGKLSRKLTVVSGILDGTNKRLEAQVLGKGQSGMFVSNPQQQTKKGKTIQDLFRQMKNFKGLQTSQEDIQSKINEFQKTNEQQEYWIKLSKLKRPSPNSDSP